MTDTTVATGLKVAQWDELFFREYLTQNRFAESMGADENAVVQVKENLTKKKGDRIHFALVNKLAGSAVTGSAMMWGNEEKMESRSFPVTVDKRRNAVRVAEIDEQYSAISLRNAAKVTLQDWAMKDTEKLIIDALASINGVKFSSATSGQKDAWLTDNADRVLFGKDRTNTKSTFALSAAELDTTNDVLTAKAISKMKTVAETVANPLIRPIRSTATKGRRYYIVYAHPYAFNDLKNDEVFRQAQREVRLEMENERLFEGGDLLWDGCIIKQVEQAVSGWDFGTIGTSSAKVVGAFLCGAQAVGTAYARRWASETQVFDYGDKNGVEISSIYGVEKIRFGSGTADTDDYKDHGVVSGYFATAGLV